MKQKLLCLFVLYAAATALASQALASSLITVKGSDTMVILAQKWAEVYMSKNPDVKLQVTGGGTGTGFAALQNQTTDICDASRRIKAQETANCIKSFGKKPNEYEVCLDGLAVYVHPENQAKELSLAQLESIFSGRTKNWKEIGGPDAPLTVYSRENSSGTYEFFKDHVLHGKDFAATAQTMPGTAALLQAVAHDRNGIGYGGIAYGSVAKHLAIKKDDSSKAFEPSEENVLKGVYPIWRFLYLYVNPAIDKDEIARYIGWIRSSEGQQTVKDVGYFPLPPKERK